MQRISFLKEESQTFLRSKVEKLMLWDPFLFDPSKVCTHFLLSDLSSTAHTLWKLLSLYRDNNSLKFLLLAPYFSSDFVFHPLKCLFVFPIFIVLCELQFLQREDFILNLEVSGGVNCTNTLVCFCFKKSSIQEVLCLYLQYLFFKSLLSYWSMIVILVII